MAPRPAVCIATVRKFLGIIYQTLKNDWIFEDFQTLLSQMLNGKRENWSRLLT